LIYYKIHCLQNFFSRNSESTRNLDSL